MNWRTGDEDALSPVVGMMVLVGMVALGAVLVGVVASGLVTSMQSDATNEQAGTSMTQVAASLQGSGEAVAEFPDDGHAYIDESAGSMTVSVGNETIVDDESLGVLYYEHDGTRMAYQGGGVWHVGENGGTAIARPPPIEYVEHDNPTLVLPVTTIDGNADPANGDTLRTVRSRTVFPNGTDAENPVTNGPVELRIESEFYRAWGDYLEDEFNTSISYDHDARAVAADLDGAEMDSPDGPPGDGLASFAYHEGTDLRITNDVVVDSYDSTQGAYDASEARASAHVKSKSGEFSLDKSAVIRGDLEVGGPTDLTTSGAVHGDTRIGASGTKTSVPNSATFHGEFSTKESLDVSGDASFEQDVVVAGDLAYLNGDIHEDLYVHGDADAYGDGHVYGDVIVGGSQTLTESWNPVTVHGNVTENANASELRDPLEPDFDVAEPNVNVDETIADIKADNDNAGPNDVDGTSNKLTTCPTTCELTAGDYYLDELQLSGSTVDDSLRVDTSDGPVRIAVDGDVTLEGAEIEVDYATDDPQPVQFYVAGNYALQRGATVEVPNDRTAVFEVYMHPGSSWSIEGSSVFRGVVYGLSDGSERTDVSLRGNEDGPGGGAAFYGAVIGNITHFDNSLEYHRDEALGYGSISEYDPADIGESSPDLVLDDADVAYLHLERETVQVE